MATFTEHYNLDKYEDMDRPNLRDQYNAAMDKIDGALYEQSRDIDGAESAVSAMQATVAAHSTQIQAAQADATAALSNAATAQASADAAQAEATAAATAASGAATNATQALDQLNGAHVYHIQNDEINSKWNPSTWPSYASNFNAIIVYDDNTEHGFLVGSFYGNSEGTTDTTPWQTLGLVSLTDWVADTAEGHDIYNPVTVVNTDWGAGLSVARMRENLIYWTPVTGVSGTLPAREAVSTSFMFPVRRRV